jgi:hypothetical protein
MNMHTDNTTEKLQEIIDAFVHDVCQSAISRDLIAVYHALEVEP